MLLSDKEHFFPLPSETVTCTAQGSNDLQICAEQFSTYFSLARFPVRPLKKLTNYLLMSLVIYTNCKFLSRDIF